jgi:epoxyqueuosine reductase
VTTPDAIPKAEGRLKAWLEEGHHGSMAWMTPAPERRADPRALWPEVRSIVVVGMNYGPDFDPLASLGLPDRGTISVYARSRDYHDVLKGKLKELAGFLAARSEAEVKVFVDTAPVMEKPLAAAAGLGWQGKHTVLVSREFGNWLFLAASSRRPSCPRTRPRRSVAAPADAASTCARPTPFRRRSGSTAGAAFPT